MQINLYSTAFRIKHQIIILVKQEKKKKNQLKYYGKGFEQMEPNKGKERQGEGCSFFFMCKYPVMTT